VEVTRRDVEATILNVETTERDVEVTRRDLQATRREFETQLAAVEARTRCGGGGNAGTSAFEVWRIYAFGSISPSV
jgi:hypothetical protein